MIKYIGRSAKILGTSKYIPEKIMTNKDFEKIVETNDQWIVERTGIRKRHFALDGEKCSDLAYRAALLALEDSGLTADQIDMILVGNNSPDTVFPSVSCKVQGRLGAVNAGAIDIQAGCTGSLTALTVAASGISSGIWDKVLVIGAEVFRDIIDWTDRGTCILFGDGAGACVIGVSDSEGGFTSTRLLADGTGHEMIRLESDEDHIMPIVKMKGNEVFKFVNTVMPKFIKGFCEESGVTPEDIDFWIFHQANTRIIDGVFKRLHVSQEKTLINLPEYGNTSAASLMITLHEAMEAGRIKSGDKVCFVAFGAGMTLGVLLYEA
ncbi:MAG: ketoacyl-ACP synthase III [Synergistaceae bacterium]|nr:ketoacyl-ACP synthase III [Synergistaceae bacterium]